MRCTRIYHDGILKLEDSVELSKDSSHHLKNVLRIKTGEYLEVFDKDGQNYLAQISKIDNKSVIVNIIKPVIRDTESSLNIEIGICLIKSNKMDFAIQKAVELGVNAIYPLVSSRTNINLNKVENKIRHWRNIIINACEQSWRSKVPYLSEPRKLSDWQNNDDSFEGIYFDPNSIVKARDITLKENNIKLLVGPEGGLTDMEIKSLENLKWQTMNLGKRILRSETAVIAGITILQSLKGDM